MNATDVLPRKDRYRLMSKFYYWLERWYSGGQIKATKLSQTTEITAGDSVLFAGVGGGEDALAAAQKGASVVAVDSSSSMLAITNRKFEAASLPIAKRCVDIRKFETDEQFDVVVANFFLNVFDSDEMPRVLKHLNSLLRPGGKLLIADFAPLSGSWLSRALQSIHWKLPLYTFRLITANSSHPIYDYRVHCEELGLVVTRVEYHTTFGRGPRWYWSIVTQKA